MPTPRITAAPGKGTVLLCPPAQHHNCDPLSPMIARFIAPSKWPVVIALASLTLSCSLALIQAQSECVPCPSELIAWWPGDGSASNLAGSGDGSLQNGAAFAAGKVDQAFDLRGSSDHIFFSSSPALHSDRQLTVMGWFNANTLSPEWQTLVWKGNTPDCTTGCENREFGLWIHQTGRLYFASTPVDRIGTGQLTAHTPTGLIAPGYWHHFAAVLNSDEASMSVFLGGTLEAVGPYSNAGIRTSTEGLHLGVTVAGSHQFNGLLDEVVGPMLRREALRRGMGTALKVVLLIDGAEGLAHMGTLCCKDAVQIVDFFHALEHAGEVMVALLGSKEHPEYESRRHRWADRLLEDGVEALIAETRQEATALGRAEAVEQELGYFVGNVARMQYGTFRQQGFFLGSGVIEAGCKTVIGTRCKQSGMFWSVPGAENSLAFRCIHASRRIADFWKYRLNQRAALNDTLPLAA